MKINAEVLYIQDGPMLQHGLKDMHDQKVLWSPARKQDRADPDRLEMRYQEFLAAAG